MVAQAAETFRVPKEVQTLQQRARGYIQNEIVPLEAYLDYDANDIPQEERERLEKKVQLAGLWNMGVPEQYGGSSLSAFARAVIEEELIQHRAGLYTNCYRTLGHGAIDLLYEGSDYIKETWLFPTLRGERSGFFGITEPSGGSDPARAIRTYAVQDGDDWVITGSKIFVGSGQADYGVVFVRTDPESRRGITAFVIDRGTPGYTWQPVPVLRAAYPQQLFFDNVRVSNRNIVGEVHGGWKLLAVDLLAKNRVSYSVDNLGLAVGSHHFAAEHAKTRETHGAPLSTRQAVQWMLVDNAIELKGCRWLCWEAAWKVDNSEDYRYSASLAKVFSSEVLQRSLDRSIQILGARALERNPRGLPLERWYREARIRRVGEGPSEVQRIVVARDMLSVGSGTNTPSKK